MLIRMEVKITPYTFLRTEEDDDGLMIWWEPCPLGPRLPSARFPNFLASNRRLINKGRTAIFINLLTVTGGIAISAEQSAIYTNQSVFLNWNSQVMNRRDIPVIRV